MNTLNFDDIVFPMNQVSPSSKTANLAEINAVRDDIELIVEKIDEISKENVAVRTSLTRLQNDLAAVTKAHNSNINASQASNQALEEEHQILVEEITRQQELIEKIKPIFTNLYYQGYKFRIHPNLDYEYLCQLCGLEPIEEGNEMNPVISKISRENDYFQDCLTGQEVVDRCKELMDELKELKTHKRDDKADDDLVALRQKLAKLQAKLSTETALIAQKMKEKGQEKDEILSKIDYYNRQIRERTPNKSGTNTPSKSPYSTPGRSYFGTPKGTDSPLKSPYSRQPKSPYSITRTPHRTPVKSEQDTPIRNITPMSYRK